MNKLDRRFLDVNLTIEAITSTPPEDPNEGDQYIIGDEAGTGAFADATSGAIARYENGVWTFTSPDTDSFEVLNRSTGEILKCALDTSSIPNRKVWKVVGTLGGKTESLYIVEYISQDSSQQTFSDSPSIGAIALDANLNYMFRCTTEGEWGESETPPDGVYAAPFRWQANAWQQGATWARVSNGTVEIIPTPPVGTIFLERNTWKLQAVSTSGFVRPITGGMITQKYTLTANQITSKTIDLTMPDDGTAPFLWLDRAKDALVFLKGLLQEYGEDYTINDQGFSLAWAGRGWDGHIQAGDKITVVYYPQDLLGLMGQETIT